MPDLEKVLALLEICGKNRNCSFNCPYRDWSEEFEDSMCREDLMADALSLLKEQEERLKKFELERSWDENPDRMGNW